METTVGTYPVEMVRQLARSHFDLEEGLERIIWVKNGDPEEIRLIEVNRDIIPTGEFYAFYFAPSSTFPLPIHIADVTPEEWTRIQRGEMDLPPGWAIKQFEEFERANT